MNPFYYDPDNPHRLPSTSSTYNNRHLESTQISASSANSSFSYSTPNVPYESSIYPHPNPSSHYPTQIDSHRHHLPPPQTHSEAIYHPNTFLHYSGNYDQSSSLLHFDQAPRIASPQPLYSPPLPNPSPRTRRSSLPIPPPLPSSNLHDDYDASSGARHRGKRTRRASSIKLEDEEEAPTPVSQSARSLPNPSTSRATPIDSAPTAPTSVSLGEESTVVEKAEKSCKACRGRKVRCSRTWPKCSRCVEKGLECFYGHLVPLSFLKSDPRIQELEEKIRMLEASAKADNPSTSSTQKPPRFPSAFPHLPSSSDFTTSITSSVINRILVDVPCKKQLAAHVKLVEEQVWNRSREGGQAGSSVRDAFVKDLERLENLQALSLEDRVRTKDWARFVAFGLLDAFWSTCASCLPTFRPLLARRNFFYESIDQLNPRDRVVVALFCATGARSTNDLALLGLGLGQLRRGASNEGSSIAQAREDICMSIRSYAMGLYDQSEVAFEGASREGLEVHTASSLIMLWNELLPKRSRGLLRTGLSMYRDLHDAAGIESTRLQLMKDFGLPLLNLDSTLAAYSRSSPLVSDCELDLYFSIHNLPSPIARLDPSCRAHKPSGGDPEATWAIPSLASDLSPLLDINHIQEPTHVELREASLVIYSWVIACFRWIAEHSCPKGLGQPLASSSLDGIFSLVSQVHAAISSLKKYLVQLASSFPHSTCLAPAPDGCLKPDLHLRYLCRLNRKVDDTIWLTYSMVRDRLAESQRGGNHESSTETISEEWLRLTEAKIIEGLRLSAFYFRVYLLSPIPHEVHHLAWSLETLPTWPHIAVEHYSRPENSTNQLGLELHEVTPSLTEQELDYIEAGLETTYHPVVVKRLQEMRELRLERNGGGGKATRSKRRPLTATTLTFREAVLQASEELNCL